MAEDCRTCGKRTDESSPYCSAVPHPPPSGDPTINAPPGLPLGIPTFPWLWREDAQAEETEFVTKYLSMTKEEKEEMRARCVKLIRNHPAGPARQQPPPPCPDSVDFYLSGLEKEWPGLSEADRVSYSRRLWDLVTRSAPADRRTRIHAMAHDAVHCLPEMTPADLRLLRDRVNEAIYDAERGR